MNKLFIITGMLLVLLIGVVILEGRVASAKAAVVSPSELDQLVAAGCNECCDPDGSWNNCDAVEGECSEVTPPNPPGYPLLAVATGKKCADEEEECTYANTGPKNAQCEGTLFDDNCQYGNLTDCNAIMNGTCTTSLFIFPGGEGNPDLWMYSCNCAGGTPSGQNSKTRITCSGDGCWL